MTVGQMVVVLQMLTPPDHRLEGAVLLLRAGVRLDTLSQASGLAAPHLAALAGDTEVLRLLLQESFTWDPNLPAADLKFGHTALHLAAEAGHIDCVRLLLDSQGVDVDAKGLIKYHTKYLIYLFKQGRGSYEILNLVI